jgi:hypothetical protein
MVQPILYLTTGRAILTGTFNNGPVRSGPPESRGTSQQNFTASYGANAYAEKIEGPNGSREVCSNLLMQEVSNFFTQDSSFYPYSANTIPNLAQQCGPSGYQLTTVKIENTYTTYAVNNSDNIPITPNIIWNEGAYPYSPPYTTNGTTNWVPCQGNGVFIINGVTATQSYSASGSGNGYLEAFNANRIALLESENTNFPILEIPTPTSTPLEVVSSANSYTLQCRYSKNVYSTTATILGAITFSKQGDPKFQVAFYSPALSTDPIVQKIIETSTYTNTDDYNFPVEPVGSLNGTAIGCFSNSNQVDGSADISSYYAMGYFAGTNFEFGGYSDTTSTYQSTLADFYGGQSSDYQITSTKENPSIPGVYIVVTYTINVENYEIPPYSPLTMLTNRQINAIVVPTDSIDDVTRIWNTIATAYLNDEPTPIATVTSSNHQGCSSSFTYANTSLFQTLDTLSTQDTILATAVASGNSFTIKTTFYSTTDTSAFTTS